MILSRHSLQALPLALALSFNPMGGAFAQANDSEPEAQPETTYSFQCDMPDVSGLSLPEMIQEIYPANVFIKSHAPMVMPFGLTPNNGELPVPNNSVGLGSGFIIDRDQGYIVTNAHVLEGKSGVADMDYTVTFYDPTQIDYQGETVRANLVGIDSSGAIDIAVLQIEVDRELTCVEFGNSNDLMVGQDVVAIGNPMGQSFTATFGRISHTNRTYSSPFHEVIQTDAEINRGNSGGALYAHDGRVYGVNTAILSSSGDSAGIGFSIPSNVVADTADKLIEHGEIKRGWLGVQLQELSDAEKASLTGYAGGAKIGTVTPSSPAESAGLQQGDIVVAIEGDEVNSVVETMREVASHRPNTAVDFTIIRAGQMMEITAIVGDREANAPIPPNTDNDILPPPDNQPDEQPDGDTPDVSPTPDGDTPAPDAPDDMPQPDTPDTPDEDMPDGPLGPQGPQPSALDLW